jgi:hypothetical protein
VLPHSRNITFKNIPYFGKRFAVIFFGLKVLARSQAIVNMVFEAYFVLTGADIGLTKVQAAGAYLEKLPDKVQEGMHHFARSIRAEVIRAIVNPVPGRKNAGESLLFYTNPWIGLIVFQHHVVAWLVFFYQVVLE